MKLNFEVYKYPRWIQLIIASIFILIAFLAICASYVFVINFIENPSYIHIYGKTRIIETSILVFVLLLALMVMMAKGIIILFKL